jgi:hypothetical protein
MSSWNHLRPLVSPDSVPPKFPKDCQFLRLYVRSEPLGTRKEVSPGLNIPESSNAEADVADGFSAKALFQFAQDFGLGNLFELVVQSRLEGAEITGSVGVA